MIPGTIAKQGVIKSASQGAAVCSVNALISKA
jgi:hypothetical protein